MSKVTIPLNKHIKSHPIHKGQGHRKRICLRRHARWTKGACVNSGAYIWTGLGQVQALRLGDRIVCEPTLAS